MKLIRNGLLKLSAFFRSRRMQWLVREFKISNQTTILDVGGVPSFWNRISQTPFLVILNTMRTEEELKHASEAVIGDGQFLPFRDQSFDLVVSNSVIEHVGDRSCQERFAKEIARVGRSYWIQTPNIWFPIEHHLLTPFIHWLPRSWQKSFVRRFTIWSVISGAASDRRDFYIEHYLRDVRLLNASELTELFPSAKLLRERVFGWTKSLLAVKNESDQFIDAD